MDNTDVGWVAEVLCSWVTMVRLPNLRDYLKDSFSLIYKMEKVISIFSKHCDEDRQNKSVVTIIPCCRNVLLIVLELHWSLWVCLEGVSQIGSSSSPSMYNQVGARLDLNRLLSMNLPVISRGAQITESQLRDHRSRGGSLSSLCLCWPHPIIPQSVMIS